MKTKDAADGQRLRMVTLTLRHEDDTSASHRAAVRALRRALSRLRRPTAQGRRSGLAPLALALSSCCFDAGVVLEHVDVQEVDVQEVDVQEVDVQEVDVQDVACDDGEACDDDNACTIRDECVEGVCAGSLAPDVCDDGDVCTRDVCERRVGCLHIQLQEGACHE